MNACGFLYYVLGRLEDVRVSGKRERFMPSNLDLIQVNTRFLADVR